MDIRQMEMAAEIVFRMCREHPEICPHMYQWIGSSTKTLDGKNIEIDTYKCGICGNEQSTVKEAE